MLDIFRNDAFSVVEMTDRILKAPHKPGRIGSLGLFNSKGVRSTTIVVEEKDGRLELIQTSPRGGVGGTIGSEKRKARSFAVPHLEKNSTVIADEVQGVRAFGSEDALEAVQAVVDERLADLRQMHEVTLEYHRVGAIKGQILDADGASVVHDLFDEFDVSQHVVPVDVAANIRQQATAIQRLSEAELGAEMVTGYRAFCGDDFFDELIESESVLRSLESQESAKMREDLRAGFAYGGITWENYRGRVSGVDFFPTDEAYVVPMGTSIFKTYFAPADFMETVNTIGLPVYSKVEPGEMNRSAKIHSQSNPLAICLRPRAVIRCTLAT